jgi:hypothetical protein
MSNQIKTISSITIIVLLGLSVVSEADAGTSRFRQITDAQIPVCVAEIGRHDLVKFNIAPLDKDK